MGSDSGLKGRSLFHDAILSDYGNGLGTSHLPPTQRLRLKFKNFREPEHYQANHSHRIYQEKGNSNGLVPLTALLPLDSASLPLFRQAG